MICHHQKMEKEALILGSLRRLKRQLDKETDKGGVMTAMVKDLVDLEEAEIRMKLGLCGAVVGRGGDP